MKDFMVSVTKLTDEHLMRKACEMTFNGSSHQSLLSIYKSEHSPARTQLFWIEFNGIPLFVSTHLLRHHVGSVPYQLTCRDDRRGANSGQVDLCNQIISLSQHPNNEGRIASIAENLRDNSDRYTPVNLGLMVNAQSLIDMAKLRLCKQAHPETIKVFMELKSKVAEVDPALASMMVKKCVYRNGLCGEPRCCGFNTTGQFKKELEEYVSNFKSTKTN